MLSKSDISIIKGLLNPIESKIGNLQSDMTVVKKDVKNLQSDMTVVKKDVKKIKKVMETDFGFHENQNIHVIKNVQAIQKHLGIPVMSAVAS